MKKQILNLGTALEKVQQKEISGGRMFTCEEFCNASPLVQQLQLDLYGYEAFSKCPCLL
ncbi:hypothetical protein [Tenacibaculum sp. IB213877]|uniref:hypothetical protein n=1 Tax=Tenacibaculum sp. IB213877 TaxID=3097351 RepID=UPI002A5AC061|nr:hypothetical protein [Tenacibaculum sp. IB213877]MDY0780815.1 hypothetical protein [Tenacibaculum sp. IB213877]